MWHRLSDSFEPDLQAVTYFRRRLRSWGREHLREFPWRRTSDAFAVLMAEMMLRRTRAAQVAPVFVRFMEEFGNPGALAAAPPGEVATVLGPLGLRWRVPAFQEVAQRLIEAHCGRVPDTRDMLLALPGVGPYVADAVLCFAFGFPTSIVDANTVRLAGRYFGHATNPESRRSTEIQRLVSTLLDPRDPRRSNFAMLDLAAEVCQPRHPRCPVCPVRRHCVTGSA
jgi:A/G-specific adenine glycosylase